MKDAKIEILVFCHVTEEGEPRIYYQVSDRYCLISDFMIESIRICYNQ